MNPPNPTARLRPFRPVPFGRYTLLAELAKGGMGEIFLARMEGPNGFEKLCVIKKILPHLTAEADFVERFVHEAKTLVKLSHGSIAQVLDMGVIDGEPYLALEHVDGKDVRKIAARMRDRQLPTPLTVVLYVMSRVLDALAYAHRKRDDDDREIGLVHRDISPQNVLVSYEGEVKVIDFGLAKSTLSSARTNPSIILGKFLYMAPEQARHQGVDRRSDLYAVGLCLYELIHGKNPFDDAPAGELMANVANPNIPPLGQVEPFCPPQVSAVVMKALAVDPGQRFQTAEEFRGRLLSCLLDIDPAAGPESVSRFMRDAFAAEYQAERRMLSSLREQLRQPSSPMPLRADTGVLPLREPPRGVLPSQGRTAEVTPLMRSRTAAPRPSEAVTIAMPALSGPPPAAETTAPRVLPPELMEGARPTAELPMRSGDTRPGVPAPLDDTDPRVVVPLPKPPSGELSTRGMAPQPRTLPDARPSTADTQPRAAAPSRLEDTQPRVELPEDRDATRPRAPYPEPRVVVGTLIEEDEPDEPTPSPDRVMDRTQEHPSPNAATQLLPTPLFAADVPSPGPRSIWRYVIPIVLVTFAAVAYFIHDMYRSGAFLAERPQIPSSRPSDLSPVPGTPPPAPPQTVTAPPVAPPGPSAEDAALLNELEPLTPPPAPKKPVVKKLKNATLRREWTRARAAFTTLERSRPCELASMALLCARYEDLQRDIDEAAGSPNEAGLIVRVRAFRAMVDQRAAKK